MTISRSIAVIGSGPMLAVARAIATELRGADRVTAIELPPDRIADVDVRAVVGRPPTEMDAFAAVGLHALNYARADLCAKLAEAGYAFAMLVHPRAMVDRSATLASSAIVCAGASVGPDASVEAGAVVLDGARIESGARVGPYAWIGANVAIGFGASVGAHTILRPGVNLDANVQVGSHCELSTPGLRQVAVPDCTFDTGAFDRPVRVYRAWSSTGGVQPRRSS